MLISTEGEGRSLGKPRERQKEKKVRHQLDHSEAAPFDWWSTNHHKQTDWRPFSSMHRSLRQGAVATNNPNRDALRHSRSFAQPGGQRRVD